MSSPVSDLIYGQGFTIDVAIRLFSIIAIIIVLFPIHEGAHALSAKLLGDDTAEREGRLTLNPLAHLDLWGTLLMFFAGFGWAKPVPVNPRNATRKITVRGFMALTALAGPVSNIILSLVLIIIAKIIGANATGELGFYLCIAFDTIAQFSVYLAVFNFIPIPPLDGSKVLMYFLPNRQAQWLDRNMQVLRIVIFVLILAPYPFDILRRFIAFFSGIIMTGLDYATFFIK